MPPPPIIACGYKIDLPYLLDFLDMEVDEDMANGYAAMKLEWWYRDLPRDQRESYPEPVRYTRPDHTYTEIIVMLLTRLEAITTEEAIDERLLEMDIDSEKRDNFIKSIADEYKIDPLSFDLTHLQFDMKEFSPGPLGKQVA